MKTANTTMTVTMFGTNVTLNAAFINAFQFD